jgi:hypothetical protein
MVVVSFMLKIDLDNLFSAETAASSSPNPHASLIHQI